MRYVENNKMNKLGYFKVGSKIFLSKNQAIYDSNFNSDDITWHFNDEIYDSYIASAQLGNANLDHLYKLRAQQLRDRYDYLILNYSGGPDSHNILMTFLNNNIKLDEIHVKFSQSVDSKIYTPNNVNTGSENIHSEYDYVIKPVLKKIKVTHPEIKIDIQDVFQNIPKITYDTFITAPSHYLGAFELLRQSNYSDSIRIQSDKGKKVADIYGIDKPLIVFKNNIFYTLFMDTAVSVAGNRNSNIELFYWTPDMPEIPFEQAYKVCDFFKRNPALLPLIDISLRNSHDYERVETLRQIGIQNIYTTWDHTKFQVNKSRNFSNAGRSRDKYYIQHPEFQNYIKEYNYYANVYGSAINKKYFDIQFMQNKTFYSKWYKIGGL